MGVEPTEDRFTAPQRIWSPRSPPGLIRSPQRKYSVSGQVLSRIFVRNSTSEYLCNESLRYGKEKRQPILAAFDNATIGIYNAVIIMAIQNIRLLFSSNNARQHADAITVLAILLGMAISSISSLKTISFFSFGIDSLIIRFPWETFPLSEIEITFLIMAIIITSSILAWITRVKNRTLWFMLLLLVPLGWIGFIFIRDRNRVYQYGLKY